MNFDQVMLTAEKYVFQVLLLTALNSTACRHVAIS